jgi:hypothetical protein
VRGLHYQLPPAAEAKLVRCVDGAIFDVVVDNRPWSPTFGRWAGVELGADDAVALYVPPGCAHGYQALTDGARALYQASAPYSPEHERGIDHADPELAIAWPLPPRNVSEKDRALPTLHDPRRPPGQTGSGRVADAVVAVQIGRREHPTPVDDQDAAVPKQFGEGGVLRPRGDQHAASAPRQCSLQILVS